MKKWLLAAASLLMVVSLAGCGSTTIATLKGGKVTQAEYYKETKETTTGKQQLQTMILEKALEEQYGSKVSDKKVTSTYNTYKKQYGSSFSSVLSQSGLTTSSFKKQIKTQMLTEAALKANKKVTNADLKKQWKSYEPKVEVQHILVEKKATAETVIAELAKDNTTKNFTTLAAKYSTDTGTKKDGGKLPTFDSTDTSLDSTFKTAAFKLKTNEYTTTPIKTSYGYHVIRMIKNPGKGKMADHKKELTSQVYAKWMTDTTVMNKIITKVLKKANVSIKDKDLSDLLSSYGVNSKASSSSSSK
ncbi:peptidylprolyl isomerase PrsA [Latilactobacillus fuchuensis]|uniref:peptidylprolyl isomerase PrsA n=1 Tax=Latilactobacillus fuchuensis TaxID=164393 RepID=UPI0020C7F5E5|nr:peptidylprolyl isomerase PrsA [Latilactobacillus fuchuensis]MCP8857614.1 peptidylprolyl isomerase [Latilactobacillus fuchuensis]